MAEILTQSAQDELLSSEAKNAENLSVKVELAEIRVLGRYKEDRGDSLAWYYDGELDPSSTVKLAGYVEADDGTIDTQASDDELLRRLRLVVASVVNWGVKEQQATFLDRERVGQKAVAYSDVPTVPTRVFHPLREFDERDPISGL